MAVGIFSKDVKTNTNILATPDHYVAIDIYHGQGTANSVGNSVLVNGRRIIRAGTVYPSNDGDAIGIVLNDYDVTDGGVNMAVLIHGFVKTSAMYESVTTAARAVLPQISFLPIEPFETITFAGTKSTAINDGLTVPAPATFTLSGAKFKESASNLSNWTFANENTVKVDVASIEVLDGGTKVKFTFAFQSGQTQTKTGTLTALPSVKAIDVGFTIASAVDILTVGA